MTAEDADDVKHATFSCQWNIILRGYMHIIITGINVGSLYLTVSSCSQQRIK